jgi:hypothetical protein
VLVIFRLKNGVRLAASCNLRVIKPAEKNEKLVECAGSVRPSSSRANTATSIKCEQQKHPKQLVAIVKNLDYARGVPLRLNVEDSAVGAGSEIFQ